MASLSERRIEHAIQLAQLSLYVHERDTMYPEILELVDEMMELLGEVRRDRAVLLRIASRWDEVVELSQKGGESALLAMELCNTARAALDLPRQQLPGLITTPTPSPAN